MKLTNCPDCGNALRTRNRCSCGWRKEFEEEVIVDFRCHYQVDGKRCHLPGTIANSPYGKNVTWYCSYHSPYASNTSETRNAVNDITYDDYAKERTDWRRELFPEERQIYKKNIK